MKRSHIVVRICVVAFSMVLPSIALAAPGSLDPAFGHGGFVVYPGDPYAVTDIKVQSNGRILISGDMAGFAGGIGGFSVLRLLPGGKPDASFGVGGLAVAKFGSKINTAESLAIQSDGKIVAAGLTAVDVPRGSDAMAIARFRPGG
ncbi:MAG TPA: hypothetical protein VFU90_08590, partial [Candidatus Tumulicola sp.]|nr:hypothetical protein [Candidatus Tumulicola sp.]